MSENLVCFNHSVTKNDRRKLNDHNSFILWFTGLSGSGKSTLSSEVEQRLHAMGIRTYLLDGDNMRSGLSRNLGFSDEDRAENIRRVGEVAKLFVDAGIVVLAAFISPFDRERQFIRQLVNEGEYFEIFLKCPLEVCEKRDPKGLYRRARKGEIKNFTGLDSAYEAPADSDIKLETDMMTVSECSELVIKYLIERGLVSVGRQRK